MLFHHNLRKPRQFGFSFPSGVVEAELVTHFQNSALLAGTIRGVGKGASCLSFLFCVASSSRDFFRLRVFFFIERSVKS